MYPLMLRAGARHRREPSVRQRIRAAITVLAALALIAGFGIFGGTLLGGVSGQARVLKAIGESPISLPLAGWALCAIPIAGLFGLLMPTQSRLVRLASLLLLIPGGLAMVAMSKPRGLDTAEWRLMLEVGGADASAFLHAVEITSYTLMGTLFVWALISAVTMATTRRKPFDDLWTTVRRSAFLVAPLALTASYTAVQLT